MTHPSDLGARSTNVPWSFTSVFVAMWLYAQYRNCQNVLLFIISITDVLKKCEHVSRRVSEAHVVKGFKRVCRDSGGDETCGMMAAHAKITYTLTKHTHTHVCTLMASGWELPCGSHSRSVSLNARTLFCCPLSTFVFPFPFSFQQLLWLAVLFSFFSLSPHLSGNWTAWPDVRPN